MSDTFHIKSSLKQGHALSAGFQLCIKYAIRVVQANQQSLKLNGTCQLLVYDDDINIFGAYIM